MVMSHQKYKVISDDLCFFSIATVQKRLAIDIVSSRTVGQVGLDVHVKFLLMYQTTVQTMQPVHFVVANEPTRSRPTELTVLNVAQRL